MRGEKEKKCKRGERRKEVEEERKRGREKERERGEREGGRDVNKMCTTYTK